MSVIKKTVNLTDFANSLVEILNELAVPEYFSSIVIDTEYDNGTYDALNFYVEEDGAEKLAMIMRLGKSSNTSTVFVIYGATESLSLSITDGSGSGTYGHYQYVFATENGLVFSTDTNGTYGSSVIITKDINGDTVLATTHQGSGGTSRTVTVMTTNACCMTVVRPGKSELMGYAPAMMRSTSYPAELTTLVPLILSDGSMSYCDKTFFVVQSQYFGTGELDVGNDHFLFTTNFAILDS